MYLRLNITVRFRVIAVTVIAISLVYVRHFIRHFIRLYGGFPFCFSFHRNSFSCRSTLDIFSVYCDPATHFITK